MKQYEQKRNYVNWLYHVPGIGRMKLGRILSQGFLPDELYRMKVDAWRDYLVERCGFSVGQAELAAQQIERRKGEKTPEQLAEELYKNRISFFIPGDLGYPKKLEQIPDAPAVLYRKGGGGWDEERKSVAIIGARECSQYGRCVAQALGERCAQLGLAVVSGMAYGVDGIAQSAALSEEGMVAAVLGSGVDVCYPPSNRKLYDELCQRGNIYSEYIPKTEPRPTNFPPRNRIISGMADAIVVVEAKEKSGTLITVDMALEQGRDVYVIPGRVTDPMSAGCNRLVRQGAAIVCDVDETLEEIAGKTYVKREAEFVEGERSVCNPYEYGSLRYAIYQTLDIQPKSVQQILESHIWKGTGMDRPSVEILQTELFLMQMEGAVWERGGRFGI